MKKTAKKRCRRHTANTPLKLVTYYPELKKRVGMCGKCGAFCEARDAR